MSQQPSSSSSSASSSSSSSESSLDMSEILKQAAQSPASGSVDGQSFTNHSLSELMELDRYLASRNAAANGKLGIGQIQCRRGSVHD